MVKVFLSRTRLDPLFPDLEILLLNIERIFFERLKHFYRNE